MFTHLSKILVLRFLGVCVSEPCWLKTSKTAAVSVIFYHTNTATIFWMRRGRKDEDIVHVDMWTNERAPRTTMWPITANHGNPSLASLSERGPCWLVTVQFYGKYAECGHLLHNLGSIRLDRGGQPCFHILEEFPGSNKIVKYLH